MNRWSNFTDSEIYMLKRMTIESSFEIMIDSNYDERQKKLHADLMNELTREDADRMHKTKEED